MTVQLDNHWPLITVNTAIEKALIKASNPYPPAQNPRKPLVRDICPEPLPDKLWQKGMFVDTYI